MPQSATRGPRVDVLSHSVRDLRIQRGWTQLDLAYHSSLTPQTISRIENGWQSPNLVTCQQLANALGVALEQIVGSVMLVRPPRKTPAAERFRQTGSVDRQVQSA